MKRFTSIQSAGAARTHLAGLSSTTSRAASSYTHASPAQTSTNAQSQTQHAQETPPKVHAKTTAQLDEELRSRLEALSGDGGAAGVEYENGRAEGLRSEVKRNMFRVINMK